MTQVATNEPQTGSPANPMSPGAMLLLAATFLGNARTAQLLSIEERSLRAKLAGDRGVTAADLRCIVSDLERRARAIDGHVAAIKAILTPEASCPTA
ncbi:hypothetical protein [Sphingomonas turrisvirgatae]|uniref:Uncharacterized protein n=1 Tax=Sphingomonas turrisvirgatae TaxID=1888892 RepID=A0A1E3LZV9_9SPHN|nr:hypothetical protein [Sphingomonas turrisvirgatae]ODP39274.1 hypothetical protein BFL28_10700 [Sphingomonas turrisvirgatae]